MRWGACAVAAVLLSGCVGGAASQPTDQPSPTTLATRTLVPTPTPTERPTLPPDLPTRCSASPAGPPDPKCNPGLADPAVTQDTLTTTICAPGYAERASPPQAYLDELRAQQLGAYAFDGDPGSYTEDHVLAIGLGGDPRDPRNLWPQSGQGLSADRKHELEKWAHDEVCSGRMTLAAAQARMLSSWRSFYQVMAAAKARGDVATAAPALSITITLSKYGAVRVTTKPGAQCVARVLMPGASQGISLAVKAADASGVVSWDYPAPFTNMVGIGKHTISCTSDGEVSTNGASFGVPTDTGPGA
ncbi:MAG: hypothetical protein KGN00_05715 [Chloroflexota bacterium]|nr:hypothetical protein [Chloroflexota bacterium]